MKQLVFILLTLTSDWILAQDKPRKFEFGFGGGVNYSVASNAPSSGNQVALPGFNAGLVVNYRISSRFFVDVKTYNAEQNTKYTDDVLSGNGRLEIVNHYSWIAVPVQLNYIFTPKFSNKFFIGLGLAPKRSLDSRQENKFVWVGPVAGKGSITSSTSGQANEWSLSALYQAGVQIPLKQGGKLITMLSYERSVVNIIKSSSSSSSVFDPIYAPSVIKLNSFSVGVIYVY